MKLVTLRGYISKTCANKKCGVSIHPGQKAWKKTSHIRSPEYYCKKCGDEMHI